MQNFNYKALNTKLKIVFKCVLVLFLFSSCTASRTILHSGKVTPKGDFKLGGNFSGNIPTQTITSTSKILISAAQNAINHDSILYDEHIDNFSTALLAYSVDPLTSNFDLYVRYGLLKRVDVGYKFVLGAHVFDAMFQFMGSTGTLANPGEKGMCGSLGIQYSSQGADLPNMFFLEKLGTYLDFTANRKDIMVPLVFSVPIGTEEEYGHFAFGVAYNHTFLKYGFEPSRVFKEYAGNYTKTQLPSIMVEKNFPAFGGFFNAKAGYKYVYFLASLSIWYQNYGSYEIPGGKFVELSGLTFIPNIGLQFHLHSGKGSKAQQ